MSTVGDVIDRVLRDFLQSPEDQPARFALNGSITADATTLVYDPALLAPEEADLLGPGTLIEFSDGEQALVGAVDEEANELSGLVREANGTTADAHLTGSLVTVSPTWSRRTIFDAVADAVVELWPDLYYVTQTAGLSFSSTPTEVAATVGQPLYVWARPVGASNYDRFSVSFLANYPPSSTGKAIWLDGLTGAGYLVYRSKFARPTTEADTLASLGVEEGWVRLLVVSAVAYLIAARDIDAATSETLTRSLSQQGFPVASGARLRDSLLRHRELLVRQAKKSLRTDYEQPVVETVAVL